MDRRPIGVFDSGLGGLTVVREIVKRLPSESIVYLGDTARVPYGSRSKEVVSKFSEENTRFLLREDVKCVVVACNTSSALALGRIKRISGVPVFGVVRPASKKAGEKTERSVGVIGTSATIASSAYKKQLKKINPKLKVYEASCPLLVPFIEEGKTSGELLQDLLKEYLRPIMTKAPDVLILGCTHYPIVGTKIQKLVGKSIRLINPAEEVIKELEDYLVKTDSLAPKSLQSVRKYYVTDLTHGFKKVAKMFLGKKPAGEIVKVSL